MNRGVRVKLGEKAVIPGPILEDFLSIHPAIDVEEGHIVCHHSSLSLLVAESPEGPVPLIVLSECLYATAGEEYVRRLAGAASSESSEAIVRAGSTIIVGSTEIYNPEVIELLSIGEDVDLKLYDINVEGLGKAIVVTLKGGKYGEGIALIAVNCRVRREKRETLHY
ncbi:MAG: hypothetical protein P3X22_006695 [Thermoprotei archaeon]|nr:hypothetical protein [Thermoprotei archaeon]